MSNSAPNYSLLGLFQQEVETQAAILNENLFTLDSNPDPAHALESLVRAAHAIHGAARLVASEADVSPVITLTDRMKRCFATAQRQATNLSSDQVNTLLQGVDWLLALSRAPEADLAAWLTENPVEEIVGAIAVFSDEGSEGAAGAEGATGSEGARAAISQSNRPSVMSEGIAEPELIEPTSPPAQETLPAEAPPTESTATSSETESPAASPLPRSPAPQAPPSSSPASPAPTAPLVDASMLDLFRLEVEAQAEILNQGLLALESQPDSPQELEALMRAAHSVKGAARIVAIDGAVNLAHVMEDCFVAAQNRQVTLTADDVDQLLHGVDLLLGIGQSGGGADLDVWMAANYPDLEGTRQAIAAILDPNAASPVPAAASESTTRDQSASSLETAKSTSQTAEKGTEPAKEIVQAAPTQIETKPKETAAITRDRVVRVSAENLNRIMGLAGESLVEANWLERFADSLVPLRRRQGDLSKALQGLQESLAELSLGEEGSAYLSTSRQKVGECSQLLGDRLDELELFVRRSANLSDRLYREVIASHMRPFEDGVQGFPRMIRDLARKLDKQVRLDIIGKPTPVDRDILKKLEAPLTHILRNSVDHGIEMPAERLAVGKPEGGTVRLEASHRGGMLTITVSDDGKGIDPEQLRQKIVRKEMATEEMVAQMQIDELMEFLFLPGFSTAKQVTEISGRGVGLDIAKSMAQEVGGNVRAFSQKGKGTSFHFQLPLTLSVVRTLIAEIAGEAYAFPLARIDQIVMVPKDEVSVVENRQYFTMNGANIGLITAHQVFELDHMPLSLNVLPVIVLSDQFSQYGLIVDQFLGERDLVVRPLDPRLGKVPDINAAALREDGSLVLIVDVADLVRSMDKLLATERLEQVNRTSVGTAQLQKRILVADDSITVREMERKLLQHHGYYVEVAIDGMEAWNAVRVNQYDLVVTDIDMPRMTGFELVRNIKNHPKLHDLPVIVVSYKDREEDRVQGMEAGADYYLTKSSFHDDTLVQAVIDTIGR